MTRETRNLSLGELDKWSFLHGEWADGDNGELLPPDGTDIEYLAVKHDEVYGDFTAWINDIPVADLKDDTYASGRVGLAGIVNPYVTTPHFAGLEIDGTPAPVADWPGLEEPTPHWITPCPEADPNCCQSYANLIQAKSGEVTLYLTYGEPNWCETLRAVFVRSADAGKTWDPPQACTLDKGLGAPFVRDDGTWVCVHANHSLFKWPLYAYESQDDGRTWRLPKALEIQGGWPEAWKAGGAWRPVRMRDGALVLPVWPVSPMSRPRPRWCRFGRAWRFGAKMTATRGRPRSCATATISSPASLSSLRWEADSSTPPAISRSGWPRRRTTCSSA